MDSDVEFEDEWEVVGGSAAPQGAGAGAGEDGPEDPRGGGAGAEDGLAGTPSDDTLTFTFEGGCCCLGG
jgi:hypothetical protein